ncbi:MAG: YscQ/HrcQ family type III secretion apparatus protein, partial [Myxococcaceae bacterium]|nr:YscQ/HrcQ family type III secretion apparatus protein [Myxococcaceae bacterium]
MDTDIDRTISTTLRAARLHRFGTRRMTRAHLSLQRRPSLCAALSAAAGEIARALGTQLSTEVTISTRCLDTAFRPDAQLSADAALLVLDLDACGGWAVLEIERPVLGAALDRLAGTPTRSTPIARLTRIEESAFGFLALVALKAARANEKVETLFAPRLRAVNPSRSEAKETIDGRVPHVGVLLSIRIGTVEGEARLFVPARVLQNAVQAEPHEPFHEIAPEILAATLTLRTFMGRSVLDANDLQSLRPGDCVLFDELRLEEGRLCGAGRLSCAGFDLFGDFSAAGFTFTRALVRTFPQESSMNEPQPNHDAPALPVDVEIELTRLRLTPGSYTHIR